jgi:hypothetical protein
MSETGEREAINLLSEWRPLPERLTGSLPPATLRALLKVAQRLRAHGYADRRYRKPERLKAMELLLRQLAREPEPTPGEDESRESAAAQSLHLRVTDALRQAESRGQIARARLSGQ